MCRLSADERDILDTATFDCMRDAGLKQKLVDMEQLVLRFERDPDKALDQMTEEYVTCAEKLLKGERSA